MVLSVSTVRAETEDLRCVINFVAGLEIRNARSDFFHDARYIGAKYHRRFEAREAAVGPELGVYTGFVPEANTRTSTSPGPGSGRCTSRSSKMSEPPNSGVTIALIRGSFIRSQMKLYALITIRANERTSEWLE